MAERTTPEGTAGVPSAPSGGPATPPRIGLWLMIYTVGRIGIMVAAVLLLLLLGLPTFPALLFGVLLSMPIAYLLLRPSRERLTEGLAARSVARRDAKAQLRARLEGDDADA